MADFAKLAATATRLIEKNGRSVRVVKYGNNPQDQDKPWRGQKTYLDAQVTGIAAFVPKTQLIGTFAGQEDGLLRETEYALFAAENDAGYHLEQFDAIVDGDRTWRITRTEILCPAATRVIYMFEVAR